MSRDIRTKVACINWGKDPDAPRAMTYQLAESDDGEREIVGSTQYFADWQSAVISAHTFWTRILEKAK